jgi:hypothetical protein
MSFARSCGLTTSCARSTGTRGWAKAKGFGFVSCSGAGGGCVREMGGIAGGLSVCVCCCVAPRALAASRHGRFGGSRGRGWESSERSGRDAGLVEARFFCVAALGWVSIDLS